jgi:cytochrome c-type biogenesis protein CcmE
MTRKHRRMVMLLACGVGLGSAAALTFSALGSSMTFFLAPAEIAAKHPEPGREFRLGGLVQQGSLQRREQDGSPSARFVLTDGRGRVTVSYVGILPDLFREGQGIVALGSLDRSGVFQASEVLAKHDENYMPKEVVAALKKAGEWNPATGAPPPPAAKWNDLSIAKAGG